jgi:hypothetical protein
MDRRYDLSEDLTNKFVLLANDQCGDLHIGRVEFKGD